jgi:hypothetical protein
MGMSMHDRYYEPDCSGDNSDEVDEMIYQIMKPGAEYDPNDASRVSEALGEMSPKDVEDLQACIDTGNYEIIGRKIMMIAFDYMEGFARSHAEHECQD